jgi:hypothetical protein
MRFVGAVDETCRLSAGEAAPGANPTISCEYHGAGALLWQEPGLRDRAKAAFRKSPQRESGPWRRRSRAVPPIDVHRRHRGSAPTPVDHRPPRAASWFGVRSVDALSPAYMYSPRGRHGNVEPQPPPKGSAPPLALAGAGGLGRRFLARLRSRPDADRRTRPTGLVPGACRRSVADRPACRSGHRIRPEAHAHSKTTRPDADAGRGDRSPTPSCSWASWGRRERRWSEHSGSPPVWIFGDLSDRTWRTNHAFLLHQLGESSAPPSCSTRRSAWLEPPSKRAARASFAGRKSPPSKPCGVTRKRHSSGWRGP